MQFFKVQIIREPLIFYSPVKCRYPFRRLRKRFLLQRCGGEPWNIPRPPSLYTTPRHLEESVSVLSQWQGKPKF